VPDSKKQIRPIAQRMGIAGGVKYKHSGIFFKLSRDWQNIYGSDAMAMKSSEHELKGCMAYLDCRIQGLHTPLMALVRYVCCVVYYLYVSDFYSINNTFEQQQL